LEDFKIFTECVTDILYRSTSQVRESNRNYPKQDDELECIVCRGRRRDSVVDDRDKTLGSVQRGDLRQCREQVHADAKL